MLKLIENKGNSPMYVGNTMIPPGESRPVEVAGVAAAPQAPAGPTLAEQVRELLEGTVKSVVEQLAGLSGEALDLMLDIEAADQNRKTLIEAVRTEQLRRADEKLREQQEADRQAAIEAARDGLLKARVALTNIPPDAPEAERVAAQARVDEAQAKVDALTAAEGGED